MTAVSSLPIVVVLVKPKTAENDTELCSSQYIHGSVVYRTRISYHTCMVHTVRVRYVTYAYGMFFCTIRVWLYRMRILFHIA